jgi:class 3 adenylate cyclase
MTSAVKIRQRISTLLLVMLTAIAALVVLGLVVMTARLIDMQTNLGELRNNALPRLVKLSQLSQEASATISIAPALSAKPTRFEFETLLSRIQDKETSQRELIAELSTLISDVDAARILGENGERLMTNLGTLTDVVREQITVRKRLADHIERFRRFLRPLAASDSAPAMSVNELASTNIFIILNALLDPNSARFSRNRREIEGGLAALDEALAAGDETPTTAAAHDLAAYWAAQRAAMFADKQAELSNEFKIKALVEENALIANRLLSTASNEFTRAGADLEAQIALVNDITRFTLVSIIVVVIAFAAGNFFLWFVLRRRVFERLEGMRTALRSFADNREHGRADPIHDEIGEISGALTEYMSLIDARERELQQLSDQLAKYLSPQVYDSIFSGKQEVKVASSRKKLTVFFSDIVGFTETADRLESEELTQLFNHYLSEMSEIALEHGATIDKYIGDAILIFFGDPETRGVKEDALACVKMAIAMRERMYELADGWRGSGIEKPLRIRMGIHTGFCTVGNFGSEDRMDYTIIGGAVNAASRLETAAEPGEILISYETFAHVNDQIACEEHGELEVKGIAYPIATYRVIDLRENLGESDRAIRTERPNLKLQVDVGQMSANEREEAAGLLRRVVDQLSDVRPRSNSRTEALSDERGKPK